MEKQHLAHFKDRLQLAIDQTIKLKFDRIRLNDPIENIRLDAEIKRSFEKIQHYIIKIQNYGNGTIIKVSGEIWVDQTLNRHKVRMRRSVEVYLQCNTLSEAQEIFEAQVLNTAEFIRESISYRTIPLKHITFI